MKTVTEQLAQYACYHRNRKNIATHLVGIPLIVFAIVSLLSRPQFAELAFMSITPALCVVVVAVLYYVRLDLRLGVLMAALLALCLWGGSALAATSTAMWLSWSLALFLVGWVWQFVGHYFEGRKPAFVDDIVGLVIGPLFVVAEVVFMLGLRPQLHQQVEARVEQLMRDMPAASGSEARS